MTFKNIYPSSYWELKIQEWRQSGLSGRSWCRANNVTYSTFMAWCHRLKSSNPITKQAPPSFIELKELPEIKSSGIYLECQGIRIHLSSSFDELVLMKCLKVLGG